MRRLYSLTADVAGPFLVVAAVLKKRFGGRWAERFGLKLAPIRHRDCPRLWIHGASVGEARSAASVIQALLAARPELDIYLTVGTPAGIKTAEDIFEGERRVKVRAAPLDFWGSPRRALSRIKPDALIIMETELWPNLIYEAHRSGVKLVLAAARLSVRSFRRYAKFKGFMGAMLGKFDLIAPSGPREAEFFQALGAPTGRMAVLGNPKFDGLAEEVSSRDFLARKQFWSEKLGLDGDSRALIVAGSTHPGEDELILDACKDFLENQARLLLAPRHTARTPEVLKLAADRGLNAVRASEPEAASAPVVVLDSVGHLPVIYSLGRAALVGGSFRPELTGHNPLEPAAVGRPVLFGPYMASFAGEAEELAACGGGFTVSPEELPSILKRFLDDPDAARSAGQAARDCLSGRLKAAPALASAILGLL